VSDWFAQVVTKKNKITLINIKPTNLLLILLSNIFLEPPACLEKPIGTTMVLTNNNVNRTQRWYRFCKNGTME
jgi:hypothetical protein